MRSSHAGDTGHSAWLVCAIAAIGFAFDQYEIVLSPLIVRPVLGSLGGLRPGTPAFDWWVGLLFFVPAAVGGLCGLLGGYLTDRFGRLRLIVLSIALYGAATAGAAYASSLEAFLVFRCVTWIGVCVEFVAATTWLAELFTEPSRRERLLGYTQAFAGLGGLMSAGVYYVAVRYGDLLPAVRAAHDPWRYVLLPGVLPLIPVLACRPLLRESPVWPAKTVRGRVTRPSPRELLGPALRRTTLVATVIVACCYAFAYGAIQHVPRMIPDLLRAQAATPQQIEQTVSIVQLVQEAGAIAGRLLLPMLAVRALARRSLLQGIVLAAMAAFAWLCFGAVARSVLQTEVAIFVAALAMNCAFSFWGNYLPRMYPTRLRATGESFAVNIGGRVFGTSAALLTATLSGLMPGATVGVALGRAAGTIAVLACSIALVSSVWLEEPAGARLPE